MLTLSIVEIKTNVGPNKENRKNATMKKSSSRPLLKDKKYNNLSKSKKRPSRPTSGRSNSKNRPGSGKKDSSFRSQNRSRSRDRSKQLVKTKDSSHQKIDDNALLKNFKG